MLVSTNSSNIVGFKCHSTKDDKAQPGKQAEEMRFRFRCPNLQGQYIQEYKFKDIQIASSVKKCGECRSQLYQVVVCPTGV